MKYFFLSEKNIEELKTVIKRKDKNIEEKLKNLFKKLKIKFILFFLLLLLF